MVEVNLKRNEFLKSLDLEPANLQKLQGDLSNRTFYRIVGKDSSFILMESDPQNPSFKSFFTVTDFLASHDFSVPTIFGADETGLVLMEDFGVKRIGDLLAEKDTLPDEVDEEKIYKRAADVLVRLHGLKPPIGSLAELERSKYISDAGKFITYYAEVLNGEELSASLKQEFNEIMEYLLKKAQLFPPVAVLRDYHAENLFWMFERSGLQKIGIIDYQDAIFGSPVYDLVSILQDGRRAVSTELETKIVSHYLKSRPEIDRRDFLTAYYIYGAQRNLKIIGQFSYYAEKNKQTHLLHLLPRVIAHLKNDMKHPVLLPLSEWFEKVLPQKGVVSALTYGAGNTKIIV